MKERLPSRPAEPQEHDEAIGGYRNCDQCGSDYQGTE